MVRVLRSHQEATGAPPQGDTRHITTNVHLVVEELLVLLVHLAVVRDMLMSDHIQRGQASRAAIGAERQHGRHHQVGRELRLLRPK